MEVSTESNVETEETTRIMDFDNEEHQKAYEEIRSLLDGDQRNTAMVWYAVGCKVLYIMDTAEYGESVVNKIAKHLGRNASLLYEAKCVADTWTQSQFEELLNQEHEDSGGRLSWSHFVEVQRVIDTELRDSLIEDVLSKKWSVRDLKQAIKGSPPEEATDYSQPTNLARALRNFKAESETIVEKAARYEELIFEVLGTHENEELGTPIILELLKDARETQLRVKQTCEEQLVKLDECIDRSEELQTTTEGDIQGTSPESEQTRGEE